MGDGLDGEVGRELRDAREALADARLLAERGGSVNRLYYACFHAARAAIHDRGGTPTTHGDVRSTFGELLVLSGDVPREEGRLLSDLYDYRAVADYQGGEPDVDVDELLASSEAFVERIETLLDGDGDGSDGSPASGNR